MSEILTVRKLPVVHEAMLNDGGSKSLVAIAIWLGADFMDSGPEGEIYVETLHGTVAAKVGDWIVKGERDAWPVDVEQFEATYEITGRITAADAGGDRAR